MALPYLNSTYNQGPSIQGIEGPCIEGPWYNHGVGMKYGGGKGAPDGFALPQDSILRTPMTICRAYCFSKVRAKSHGIELLCSTYPVLFLNTLPIPILFHFKLALAFSDSPSVSYTRPHSRNASETKQKKRNERRSSFSKLYKH